MAWYRSGTISLTNGSAAVTGAGTAWILNASVGEALLAPDGKLYEISAITSDTSITLATTYLGATQAGQAYVLVPTQSYIRDLAAQAAALVNTYSGIANNAGAGKFGDGTVAAPGVTFAGDQDTGFFRSGNNEVTFVANGVAQFKYSATGGVQFLSTSVDINGGTIDGAVVGGAAPAAGTFTTLRATSQIRSDSSVLAAAGTPVYLGNTTDASVAEVSSPSPAVMKLKTAYQDALTVSALTGNKSHTAFSVDTNSGASNCVLYQQTGDLKAIVGSQASIYGDSPNNYGTYLYNSSEYFVAIGGPKILRVLPSGVDVIGKLTTSNTKEDGTGNLAVGAGAPKPWAVGKAIDVGLAGAFFGDGINASWSAGIAQNAYASAYPGTWSYKVSGIGASRYQCNENMHQWFSAPAGNAGDPISFTLAMALDASGLRPGVDNTKSLGDASFRWSTVFAGTGTINTSDAREKTPVAEFTQAEISAAKQLSKEIGIYKFLDSVAAKGDGARKHVGLTVQRAIEIMEGNGLDPFSYGFICYDEWDQQGIEHPAVEAVEAQDAWVETIEHEAKLDEEGNTVVEAWTETIAHPAIEAVEAKESWTEVTREAGNRYGFRYDQLNMFIARGIEARLAELEAA